MTKFAVSLTALLFLSLAQQAHALDNLEGFRLEDGVIRPYKMTCQEFTDADDNLKLLVSAWYDGDSTTTAMESVEYAREDVLDMQRLLIQGCQESPRATLEELEFEYGGEDASYKPARCSLLNGMESAKEAAMYLGWAIGYLAEERDNYTVNVEDLYALSATVFDICQTETRANMVELVLENLD